MSDTTPSIAPPRPVRRVLLHLGCAVVCLALAVAALEMVLRTFDGCGLVDPVRLNALNAARAASGEPPLWEGQAWAPREFAQPNPVNGAGLLGPELAPDPARPFRVLVVGDSFVEARQVPFTASFVGQVRELLPDVQTLPVHVGNRPTAARLTTFLDLHERVFAHAAGTPPVDLVVFEFRGQALQEALGRTAIQSLRRRVTRRSGLDDVLSRAARSELRVASFLATRARTWVRFSTSEQAVLPGAHERAMREAFDRDLDAYDAASERLGVPFAYLYVPTLAESRLPDTERRVPTRGPRAAFAAVLGERGARFADATSALPRNDAYFPWDQHPRPAGHAAIAEVLARLVTSVRAR